MARSVEQINTQIVTELTTQLSSLSITINPAKWSKRNIIRLLCYVFAIVSAYLEQLGDTLKASIETTATKAAAASYLWVQNKMFEFQYSADNPQIIQLINTVPQYPVVDTSLRIITACSVTSSIPNEVVIKVAKGIVTDTQPFIALESNEIQAAQSYINLIGTAGIKYTVLSSNADRIYIDADIYYNGQYASIIKTSVETALTGFLHRLSQTNFNGSLKISDLENTIRKIEGVNDVVLNNVKIRQSDVLFAAGVALVSNKTTIFRQWNPLAGYVEGEDTTNYTFSDSLNYIAE